MIHNSGCKISGGLQFSLCHSSSLHRKLAILGDPGADSRGDRQIKEAKLVQMKVYKTGGRAPGQLHLTD